MVSLEKWMILTHLQKLPKNGEDWGKWIVTKGFEKLPKVQNIAQSGHTARGLQLPKCSRLELNKKKKNNNNLCSSRGSTLPSTFSTYRRNLNFSSKTFPCSRMQWDRIWRKFAPFAKFKNPLVIFECVYSIFRKKITNFGKFCTVLGTFLLRLNSQILNK